MVTKNYGLYHLIGMDALNIAHPATLVIDCGRTVQYIYRGDNQHDRGPLPDVMGAVKKPVYRLTEPVLSNHKEFHEFAGGVMRKLLGSLSVLLLAVSIWAQSGVSVPEGTPLKVNLQTTISTFSSKVGDPFQGKLSTR